MKKSQLFTLGTLISSAALSPSCLHKVEKAYQTQNISQVALLWDMTENVRIKHSKDTMMYSRTGYAWRLDGDNGRGYYNSIGGRDYNPKGEMVTYYAKPNSFEFKHNDGEGCRQIYTFKFEGEPTIEVLLKGNCKIYGDLDRYLVIPRNIRNLEPEDQEKIKREINRLMTKEIELTDWSR